MCPDLPAEILEVIFVFLTPCELFSAATASKRWRDIIYREVFWKKYVNSRSDLTCQWTYDQLKLTGSLMLPFLTASDGHFQLSPFSFGQFTKEDLFNGFSKYENDQLSQRVLRVALSKFVFKRQLTKGFVNVINWKLYDFDHSFFNRYQS